MKNNNQFGRSMIEMLGVLSVIGMLSVGGIAGYSEVMMQHKVAKTLEQVTSLSAYLSQIGEQSGTYEGLTNNVAVRMKAISENDLTNAFGGDVTIEASDLLASGDEAAFAVTYTGLPSDACLRLAAQNWQSGNSGSLVGIGFAAAQENASELKAKILMDCESEVYVETTVAPTPVEPTNQSEPVEPTNQSEPVEPTNQAEPVEPTNQAGSMVPVSQNYVIGCPKGTNGENLISITDAVSGCNCAGDTCVMVVKYF